MTSEVRVPEVPAVAVDFGTTRHVLAAYRRHASHLLFIGLGIVVITVVLAVVGAVAEVGWLSRPAPYTAGGGLAVAGLGAGALRIAGRMQGLLSGKPWIACPAVAPKMGTGPTRLVLRAPDTDELWALTVVAVQQRHPLSWPPASGVLWWCGDPSWGGIVSQPGGRTLVWTRPTRRRRREGDLRAAVSAGLLERPAPPQVQTSATGPAVTGTADTAPARRRPFFRWGALLGSVLLGLGIAGAVAAERDPQVDLTVVQEDRSGRCTVVWEDPWSGSERRGPFQCDPDRSPLLRDWESGFVVSYGPWKGDLYNSDLDGSPAPALEAGLGLTGFLVLVGSGVGGVVRWVRRAVLLRTARGLRTTGSPWPATGARAETNTQSAPLTEESADLSYAAWAKPAPRSPALSPGSLRRREADIRTVPWWRVRSLRKLSHLEEALLGAACLLTVSSLWWFTDEGGAAVILPVVVGGVMVVVGTRRAASHGLADVRRLVRAARAPVPALRPYVLVHDPCDGRPVLVLFPAHAGPDAQPEAVLAVHSPGPEKKPRRGLPDPVGTADLRGWLDEEPTVVPWIENRAFWPLHGLRKVSPTVTEDRNYLRHLMGEADEAFTCGPDGARLG
ncbi:hypothetical protein JL475_30905 [Streptomyces sp. M2CJ-2]|uniref:hypothetical protein n=1 Tax=Streptomyces sp. M2CJ-2 TaxID=2803948 RepID=UPI001927944F|nr:hypothetical protein [Streptomyces sp. M2CJ-2]MBL3670308.1 hypothetical protein [Streptomyces sp. M2CJ-2]